jgi:hypothetical protein
MMRGLQDQLMAKTSQLFQQLRTLGAFQTQNICHEYTKKLAIIHPALMAEKIDTMSMTELKT